MNLYILSPVVRTLSCYKFSLWNGCGGNGVCTCLPYDFLRVCGVLTRGCDFMRAGVRRGGLTPCRRVGDILCVRVIKKEKTAD